MKAKVIINNEDYEKEFKVRKMNFNEVVINYNKDIKKYLYSHIELISEGEIDDFLINNKTFLQIKLNRGISVFFYKALKVSLEEELREEIKELIIIQDKYNLNGRGIWQKDIVCGVNNKFPIKIMANGRNFKRQGYSISINRLEKNEFISSLKKEIDVLERVIKIKEKTIRTYMEFIQSISII
ncbi:MAG: hypothetical protein GX275_07215 [Clostridiales bacterium]|nr:hypothetical protein [Clostridiales bacterium]